MNAPWMGDVVRRPWVVLGDIHLHANCDPRVARDLASLIEQETQTSPGAVLIFNGDSFDLDRVRGEPHAGLGAERAARRVERTLDRFPGIVDALDAHMASGGHVVFIAGNHDAELLLDSVRDALLRRFAEPGRIVVLARLVVGDRMVEHGHQVDPDAAFLPDPRTALAKSRLSAFPLASLITRALLSYIPRFELVGDNHQAPVHVLARVLRDYKIGAIIMIIRFPMAGIRIVWHSALARLRGDVLASSEASMSSPLRVAGRLYLDRYFAVAIGLPLAIALLAGLVPRWVGWPLGLVAVALTIPPTRRKDFAHRDVRRCAAYAREVCGQGTRLVVLGHIHRAFVEPIEGKGVYANHGAFSSRDLIEGEAVRTYVRVDPDGACSVQRFVCS